jgi:hypothetical protein
MFLTATSASAKNGNDFTNYKTDSQTGVHDDHKAGYGTRDYKIGFLTGATEGHKAGHDAGYNDCLKSGKKGVLTEIIGPTIKDEWTENYKKGYKEGLKKGYLSGYNDARFKCLKYGSKASVLAT